MKNSAIETPEVAATSCCNYCQTPIKNGATVRLWDGRDYCAACVENACPGLGKYAATHEFLVEEDRPSFWKLAAANLFLFTASSALIIFPAFALYGLSLGLRDVISLYFGIVVLVLAPLAGICAILCAAGTWEHWPRVRVQDASFVVNTGDEAVVCSISELRWCHAPLWHMRSSKKQLLFLSWAPAIILVLPDRVSLLDEPRTVAVGLSDESRRRWDAFLHLARITPTRPW